MRLGRKMGQRGVWGLALVFFLGTLSASGQNGRTGTNTAQAVLHIQVVVMPTIFTPSQNLQRETANTVTYNLPSQLLRQELTVNESDLRGSVASACSGETCSAALRTTTVVAR